MINLSTYELSKSQYRQSMFTEGLDIFNNVEKANNVPPITIMGGCGLKIM